MSRFFRNSVDKINVDLVRRQSQFIKPPQRTPQSMLKCKSRLLTVFFRRSLSVTISTRMIGNLIENRFAILNAVSANGFGTRVCASCDRVRWESSVTLLQTRVCTYKWNANQPSSIARCISRKEESWINDWRAALLWRKQETRSANDNGMKLTCDNVFSNNYWIISTSHQSSEQERRQNQHTIWCRDKQNRQTASNVQDCTSSTAFVGRSLLISYAKLESNTRQISEWTSQMVSRATCEKFSTMHRRTDRRQSTMRFLHGAATKVRWHISA